MSTHRTTRQRIMAAAAIVVIVDLIFVAAGYPSWLWFPLTITFWAAVFAFTMSAVLEARSRLLRTRSW